MENAGYSYERKVRTVNEVLVDVGGLSKSIIGGFTFLSVFFGGPFSALDLAINFRLM